MAIPIGSDAALPARLLGRGEGERSAGPASATAPDTPSDTSAPGDFAQFLAGVADDTAAAPAPPEDSDGSTAPLVAGDLPWDMLAAAAEEASQLAGFLQWQANTPAQPATLTGEGAANAEMTALAPAIAAAQDAAAATQAALEATLGAAVGAAAGEAAPGAPQAPPGATLEGAAAQALAAMAGQDGPAGSILPVPESGEGAEAAALAQSAEAQSAQLLLTEAAEAAQAQAQTLPQSQAGAEATAQPAPRRATLAPPAWPAASASRAAAQAEAQANATAGQDAATPQAGAGVGADAALSALVPEEDSSLRPATPQAGAADKASSPAPPQPHAAPPAPVLAQASPVVLPGNETSAGLLATAAAQATQSGAAQAAQQASQQGAAPELVPQSPHHARIAAEAAPQIVLRLADAAGKGQQTVSVELTPPELGRVELRLTFREGQVHQVVMAAERSDTFEALRQDRQSLLQQMEQAGLQLGQSGLDLQHGALPRQDTETAEEQAFRLAQAAQERAGDLSAEAETPPRPASDSLIDIIA